MHPHNGGHKVAAVGVRPGIKAVVTVPEQAKATVANFMADSLSSWPSSTWARNGQPATRART